MGEEIRRVDRKLVRQCHVFDLYEDTMRTESGRTAYWDFLKHNGAAAVVPVTADGRILLVKQYRNAVDRYSLEIPAGKKDTIEESGLSCAERELQEETGFKAGKMTLLIKLVTAIAYCNETIDVYVAEDLTPVGQHLDEDEFIDVQAYDTDTLESMIYDGELQDAKTVAAVMSYLNRYRRGKQ